MLRSCNTGKREALKRTAPNHVLDDLLKLHGIDFKGKTLIIERAETPQKAKTIDGINKQTHKSTYPQIQSKTLDF